MKRLFLCFSIVACFFSCSKTESEFVAPVSVIAESETNFYALSVGNSWVYKNYKYNSNTTTYDNTGVVDSISIVGTQDISGDMYYKFRRLTTGNENNITFCNPNGEYFEFLRDENGDLVNENGIVKFTNNNTNERLLQENQWGNIYEILIDGESTLSVEAGSFECVNSERYAKSPAGDQFDGLDRYYYANGFGLIYNTSSFVSSSRPIIITRLDAYSVQ